MRAKFIINKFHLTEWFYILPLCYYVGKCNHFFSSGRPNLTQFPAKLGILGRRT